MIPVSERAVQNARECLAILEEDDFQLDMDKFISSPSKDDRKRIIKGRMEGEDVSHCGTSFCIAEWQAFKEGYPEEYRDDEYFYFFFFDHYSFTLSKVDDSTTAWEFFYSSNWSNDREYAKERMRFVIKNKAIPEVYNYDHHDFMFEGFHWKR